MYPYWTWFGYAMNESFSGYQLRYLPINFAFLLLDRRLGSHPATSKLYSLNDVGIYMDSSHCESCPFTLLERINNNENEDLLETNYIWKMATVGYRKWRILGTSLEKHNNDVGELICEFGPELGEFGVYKLDLDDCKLKTVVEPINIYLQLILFCFLLSISGIFLKKYFMKQIEKQITLRNSPPKDELESHSVEEVMKPRIETGWLSSLYIFRGCLLYFILFLTTGGGGYYYFTRSIGGLTIVECIFFAYIWTIGFKIPITMNRVFERENLKLQAFLDVSKMAGLLVVLGSVSEYFFQSRFDKHSIALWASLQRLGFSYFFVGTAYIFTAKRIEINSKNTISKVFANFKSIFWCWVIAGCLFVLQIISVNFFITFGYLSPLYEETSIMSTTEAVFDSVEEDEIPDNSSKAFDVAGFYNNVFIASKVTMPYDNYIGFCKGLMGFMTTTIFCIFGVLFGTIYLQYEGSKDQLKLWNLWIIILGIVGVVLAIMSFVLQLKLWPFVTIFLLSTWTALFFLLFYVLVESTKKMHFPLIRRTGAVSMALFVGHVIVSRFFPLNWNVNFRSHLMYLFQNFLVMLHWFTIGIFLSIKNFRFGMEL